MKTPKTRYSAGRQTAAGGFIERLEARELLTTVPAPVHPPDDQISTGPSEVILTDNRVLQFYAKSNSALLGTMAFTTIFPLDLATKPHDPRIEFDQAHDHFIFAADDRSPPSAANPNGLSYLDIAVSKTSDPGPIVSDWYVYRVNVGTPVINGQLTSWDQVAMGFDLNALYVAANRLSWTNQREGNELITLNLHQLETGGYAQGPSFITPANTMEFPDGYSIEPVFNEDAGAPVEYMVEMYGLTNGPTADQLRLYAVANPLGAMNVTERFVNIPSFSTFIPNAPQPGTDVVISTGDGQLCNAVWANGSIYTANTCGVKTATYDKAVVRYYQIQTRGWTGSVIGPQPYLAHYGGINPRADLSTYFPGIAADSLGDVVISYTASSIHDAAAAYYTTRTPAIVYSGPHLIHAGYAPYSYTPWGDYNGVSIDPTDPGVFEVSGEYPVNSTMLDAAWAKVKLSPPVSALRLSRLIDYG